MEVETIMQTLEQKQVTLVPMPKRNLALTKAQPTTLNTKLRMKNKP